MFLPNPFSDQEMSELELKETESAASKIDGKLNKLIKRARKQDGMLWASVVEKLKLARADVRAMIKVYESGPK